MAKSDFTQLNELLPKITRRYNMERQVKGALVCHYFTKIARELWNDAVDEAIQPVSYKDGILKVAVKDSGWAQQVQFKRVELLMRLKEESKDAPINDLRLTFGLPKLH